MTEFLIENVSRAVLVLVLLAAAWVVGDWLKRYIRRAGEYRGIDETVAGFAAEAARWGLIVLTILSCLGAFGISTASFAAVIAAAGLAVGLAFQGTLSNFAAGVMLLVFRPFKVGDVINVSGETGTIREIELFFTQMDTFDNRRIILPNANLFGSKIENVNFHDIRRTEVVVGVDYPADVDRTREVLEGAAAEIEGRAKEKDPQVILSELGDSAVTWTVRVWAPVSDVTVIRDRTVRAIKQALDAEGIGIPYPQMDVHLPAGETASPA